MSSPLRGAALLASVKDKLTAGFADILKLTATEDRSAWEHKTIERGIDMYKVHIENSDIARGMGVGVIEQSSESIFNLVKGIDHIREFDPMLQDCRLVETIDPNNVVIWSVYNFDSLLDHRDFCYLESYSDAPDGKKVVLQFSVEHPEAPRQPKAVRAISFNSGYLIRPIKPGETYVGEDRKQHTATPEQAGKLCEFWFLWHGDPKGNIPHWVVNLVMGDEVKLINRVRDILGGQK